MYLQQLINGLTLGATYSLIALGYTLVYGILQMINFAHGDVYMIGAFIGYFILGALGATVVTGLSGITLVWGILLAFGASMLVCGMLGVAIERVAYRPLRNKARLSALMSAVGVSIVLQNGVMLILGARPRGFPMILTKQYFHIGTAVFTNVQAFTIAVSLVLMVGLDLFITRAKWGKAVRAVAQDAEVASYMGIDADRVISLTFFAGSVLAAGGGVLIGAYYGIVDFFMGYMAGTKAFTAAVLGGIGNVHGAMLGGIVLGLVESFGTGIIGGEWKDVVAFAVLALVIILRPAGLLGERLPDKV